MRVYITALLLLFAVGEISSQTLNVENSFSTALRSKTKLGINSAYLFHHFVNDQVQLDTNIMDAMINSNFDIVRFPGGAVGSYYQFDKLGYGMVRDEVEAVDNTIQCTSNGYYCFTKDNDAPRNFIHDFIDFVDYKYSQTNQKTEILYVLNVLQHFVSNLDEIDSLSNINNIAELNAAVTSGAISDDFRDRIMNNYNAYQLIYSNPNTEIIGAELGNELYFNHEVTSFPYNATNANPFFNLNSSLNQIDSRITNIISLLDFYRRILGTIDNEVRLGIPIGNINPLGNMSNVNELWNTALRNRVLPHVDALIPHMYVQINASDASPLNMVDDDDDTRLVEIKDKVLDFLDIKFDKTLNEINDFFSTENNDLKLWLTEYNTFKNSSDGTIWDEWVNTFLHGAFLNTLTQKIATGSPSSSTVEYAIFHGWSGTQNGYEHNLFSRLNNGGTLDRIGHFPNWNNDFLKSDHARKLNHNSISTVDASNLYTEAFYSYNQSASDACPNEKLTYSVTNLRAEDIAVDFGFADDTIYLDTIAYTVISSKLIGFEGLNLASTCGKSDFYINDFIYDVAEVDLAIDLSQSQTLGGYFCGIYEFEIEPIIPTCLPLIVSNSNINELNVYPNPSNHTIYVDFGSDATFLNSNLNILNNLGQIIKTVKVDQTRMPVDINNIDAGAYFISLESNGVRHYGSFIKQ